MKIKHLLKKILDLQIIQTRCAERCAEASERMAATAEVSELRMKQQHAIWVADQDEVRQNNRKGCILNEEAAIFSRESMARERERWADEDRRYGRVSKEVSDEE